jgi:hypothetical protein
MDETSTRPHWELLYLYSFLPVIHALALILDVMPIVQSLADLIIKISAVSAVIWQRMGIIFSLTITERTALELTTLCLLVPSAIHNLISKTPNFSFLTPFSALFLWAYLTSSAIDPTAAIFCLFVLSPFTLLDVLTYVRNRVPNIAKEYSFEMFYLTLSNIEFYARRVRLVNFLLGFSLIAIFLILMVGPDRLGFAEWSNTLSVGPYFIFITFLCLNAGRILQWVHLNILAILLLNWIIVFVGLDEIDFEEFMNEVDRYETQSSTQPTIIPLSLAKVNEIDSISNKR